MEGSFHVKPDDRTGVIKFKSNSLELIFGTPSVVEGLSAARNTGVLGLQFLECSRNTYTCAKCSKTESLGEGAITRNHLDASKPGAGGQLVCESCTDYMLDKEAGWRLTWMLYEWNQALKAAERRQFMLKMAGIWRRNAASRSMRPLIQALLYSREHHQHSLLIPQLMLIIRGY